MSTELIDALEPYLGMPVGRPSDGNYKYRCPFHKDGQEKSPSFYLHGGEGVSFCHACNTGWALPHLLKLLGMSPRRRDVVIQLMPDPLPPKKGRAKLRAGLKLAPTIPESLLGVFRWCPEQLVDWGFDEDLLQAHDVGYDKHHDRIVYPIRDHKGRLVGISGRASWGYKTYDRTEYKAFYEEDIPKGLQDKSWFLWNLDRVYPQAFHGDGIDRVILVEGFKACLWMIQCGYPNTVALMGSYLSDEQKRLIERLGCRVIVMLDNNKAGRLGTERICRVLGWSTQVHVTDYPHKGDLQPDDLNTEEIDLMVSESHLPRAKKERRAS